MKDMSLHILDIAENSLNAGASLIEIGVVEDEAEDLMTITVDDDGRGIDLESKTVDQFFTSKTGKRFGLGIPFFKQHAEECGGTFHIGPRSGGGTELKATFGLGHIDRKPLGDLGATVATLVAGRSDVDCIFRYRGKGEDFKFDTRELREQLEGVPLGVPEVMKYIKQEINNGIRWRSHG